MDGCSRSADTRAVLAVRVVGIRRAGFPRWSVFIVGAVVGFIRSLPEDLPTCGSAHNFRHSINSSWKGIVMTEHSPSTLQIDLPGFLSAFSEESPRAAAIVAGSYLDTLLVELLDAALIGNKKARANLLGDDKSADKPLGTFSARIRAAHALGLISPNEYADLNTVRTIRNKFAHAQHGFSFDDSAVAGLCASLIFVGAVQWSTEACFSSPRGRFELGVAVLAACVKSRLDAPCRERPVSPAEFDLSQYLSVNVAQV